MSYPPLPPGKRRGTRKGYRFYVKHLVEYPDQIVGDRWVVWDGELNVIAEVCPDDTAAARVAAEFNDIAGPPPNPWKK